MFIASHTTWNINPNDKALKEQPLMSSNGGLQPGIWALKMKCHVDKNFLHQKLSFQGSFTGIEANIEL